jgi:hypothetical protein
MVSSMRWYCCRPCLFSLMRTRHNSDEIIQLLTYRQSLIQEDMKDISNLFRGYRDETLCSRRWTRSELSPLLMWSSSRSSAAPRGVSRSWTYPVQEETSDVAMVTQILCTRGELGCRSGAVIVRWMCVRVEQEAYHVLVRHDYNMCKGCGYLLLAR